MPPRSSLFANPVLGAILLVIWGGWISWPFVTGSFQGSSSPGYALLFGKWLLLVSGLALLSRNRPALDDDEADPALGNDAEEV